MQNIQQKFDTLTITKGFAQQYIKPVQIKNCKHIKECFEQDEIENKIKQDSKFVCKICQLSISTIDDLVLDIRYYAYQEFHKSVDSIHIINGILINKYFRKDIYLKLFYDDQILDEFLNSHRKNELFNYSLHQQNENIEFLVFCLLDYVQINIPVRIRGCTHLECYELTSLLYLQKQNSQNQQVLQCNHPKCNQQLDISSLDILFSQIYIDVQLLKVIKKSNRTLIKIKYNKETQSLESKSQFSIKELFDEFQNKYSQQRIELDEVECQTLEQLFFPVLQNNLIQQDEELKQKLKTYHQSSLSIQMNDQITQSPFEIPTRCKYCTDLNKSLDLRAYIFDFFLKKKLYKNVFKYQCPLCNHSQQQTIQVANLNKYIYIDSFLMNKMLKDQYDGEVQSPQNIEPFNSINFDTFTLLNPISKVRYANPALTKFCRHRNNCFEKEEALQEIQNNNKYRCPHCNGYANSPNDLVDDWRVNAYKEFNEQTEDVTIIEGIIVNKYTRNKNRYLNFFTQAEYINQFKQMFNNEKNAIYQINSVMRQNYRLFKFRDHKITFWCFCLLDKVKITIPVRILGCKHPECYELTSLLFFQKKNRKKITYLECNQPECSNRLKIAHKDYSTYVNTVNYRKVDEEERILDIQLLFSGICVDQDLLTAIKKSNPSSYKFFYNQQDKIIQEDIITVNGMLVDPFIEKFYQQHPDLQKKMQFQEFQKLIQQEAIAVSQGDLLQDDEKLNKQVALYKYRNYKVNMNDKATQLIIEYPVRCKLCTNLEVCMDMRSYIAHFNYQKKMQPKKGYACPICNQQLSQQILRMNIQNYIYLDSNMLSYMFKDMSYAQGTKIFEYQGEIYMFQEFMEKKKLNKENFIAELLEGIAVFSQLQCIVNPKKRIKKPLILQNCPHKNIVDFKSFYEELKNIKFDYKTTGLILCKCSYCNLNPIQSFVGNIYFHEAFYGALNEFYQKQELANDTEFCCQFTNQRNKIFRRIYTNQKFRKASENIVLTNQFQFLQPQRKNR